MFSLTFCARAARAMPTPYSWSFKRSLKIVNNFLRFPLDNDTELCYIIRMKVKKIKARVNKDGLMGSKSRVHRVSKGKGSFRRHAKHKESA